VESKETSSLTKSVSDGAEFSLRRPITLQERSGKKERRTAPLEMVVSELAALKE
jgi:hypothetical protein